MTDDDATQPLPELDATLPLPEAPPVSAREAAVDTGLRSVDATLRAMDERTSRSPRAWWARRPAPVGPAPLDQFPVDSAPLQSAPTEPSPLTSAPVTVPIEPPSHDPLIRENRRRDRRRLWLTVVGATAAAIIVGCVGLGIGMLHSATTGSASNPAAGARAVALGSSGTGGSGTSGGASAHRAHHVIRGVVTDVTASSITVRRADGSAAELHLTGATHYGSAAHPEFRSDVVTAARVVVTASGSTARRIVVLGVATTGAGAAQS